MGKKTALSIAGSDPSGGAGLQADLKAFSFLGVHGTTVVTCVTAQNTQQVRYIHKIPLVDIEHQIDVLFEDFSIDAVKTGMLYDSDILHGVSRKISQYKMNPVVDPVLSATSGDLLSTSSFLESLKKHLLPKTYLLTVNIPEAEHLIGKSITSCTAMEQAGKQLHELGPRYVLVKGGHLESDDAVDVLCTGKQAVLFSLPRIPQKKVHGTGCTLSALITGYLAHGEKLQDAIRKAKFFLWNMINEGYQLGSGATLLGHIPHVSPATVSHFPTAEHFCVWFETKTAVERLLLCLPSAFIPEVGINFGYALPYATQKKEVCAIDGRIIQTSKKPVYCGAVGFGVSTHIASIILTVMSFDPTFRSALNIKYSKKAIASCENAGLQVGSFDRCHEPSTETSTMEWGTKNVISSLHCIPDVIYDVGGMAKEPMIRLLGRTPQDVLRKLSLIL